MRGARITHRAGVAVQQIGGTKGILQWQDFCIPSEEDVCEFTLKGEGAMVDTDTRIQQSIEQKKASPQDSRDCCAALLPWSRDAGEVFRCIACSTSLMVLRFAENASSRERLSGPA